MSKANVLASLATDVNELSSLADQISEIEGAIEQANTNFHAIQSLPEIPEIPEIPPPVLSFRNKIINGDMRIDQRNAGSSVGPFAFADAGYKGVDRWFIASDAMSSQRITGNAPSGFSHYLKLTKGPGVNIDIRQSVELPAMGQAGQFNVGSVWTLSFYAKSVDGNETLNFSAYFRTGIASGDFTAISTPSSITLSTDWTRYSVLFTIDESPGSNDMCIAFGLNTTATELHLTGVQLEEGEVATPFEQRPYGVEEQLCKRYWCWGKFKVGGRATTGSGNRDNIFFSTTMRVHPTVYLSNEVKNGVGTTYPEIGGPNHFTVYWLGSVSSDHTTYYSEYSADAEL